MLTYSGYISPCGENLNYYFSPERRSGLANTRHLLNMNYALEKKNNLLIYSCEKMQHLYQYLDKNE